MNQNSSKTGAILPKQLRQISSGRIFNYNEHLAKRADMVPVWPEGVNPNFDHPDQALDTMGAGGQVVQLKREIKDRDEAIAKAATVIQDLEQKNEDLEGQLVAANQHINKLLEDLERKTVPTDPRDVIPPDKDRQGIIDTAVSEIMQESNPNDLTSQGLPRISAITSRCNLEDISSEERDAALAKFNTPQEG